MVMNFYKQQEEARRQEKIMLLLFVFMSVILTIRSPKPLIGVMCLYPTEQKRYLMNYLYWNYY